MRNQQHMQSISPPHEGLAIHRSSIPLPSDNQSIVVGANTTNVNFGYQNGSPRNNQQQNNNISPSKKLPLGAVLLNRQLQPFERKISQQSIEAVGMNQTTSNWNQTPNHIGLSHYESTRTIDHT